MKPRFNTMWGERGNQQRGNNTGTEYTPVYEYEVDENLIKGLKKTGERNSYEEIQMHADECKIETILAKATVDPSILEQRKGIYADVSEMPKSLAEYKNLEIKIIQDFEKLPSEVREKFDNSFDKYIAEYGSEMWAKALGITSDEEIINEVSKTLESANLNVTEVNTESEDIKNE